MGGLLAAFVAVLLHSSVAIHASPAFSLPTAPLAAVERRQTTSKYCDAASKVCYVECTTKLNNPVFRIAVSDGSAAPFDLLLQMIVPVSLGWAGFAWGGKMIDNPLTVAWPNGNKVTVSSRWARCVI
jgi:cellobiose dehydrogenase-like cytochrome